MRKRSVTLAGCLTLALVAAPAWAMAAHDPGAAPATAQPAAAQSATAEQPAAQPAPVEAPHQPAATPAAGDHAAAPASQPAAGDHAAAEGHGEAEAHGESPWGLIARIFNFAVLVGLLVYFLRSPFMQHLASRKQQIASDLVSARETAERARQQLAEVDRRLKELPAELEALKASGAEEVAAEGLRIRQQAETERQRQLEQTRREIDIQIRVAKKVLTEHAADLAVGLAQERLAGSITPDDQNRMVDKYVSQVKELHG